MIFNIDLFAKQAFSLFLAKLPILKTLAYEQAWVDAQNLKTTLFLCLVLGVGGADAPSNSTWLNNINTNGSLSSFVANSSFMILFLAMSLYWVDLAFFDQKKAKKSMEGISILSPHIPDQKLDQECVIPIPSSTDNYTLAQDTQKSTLSSQPIAAIHNSPITSTQNKNQVLLNITGIKPASITFLTLANAVLILANISLFLLLCIRWQESGHFPLSNLYESLMFLSWSCTSIHIACVLSHFFTGFASAKQIRNPIMRKPHNESVFLEKMLGSVLAPCALFLNAFATFSLPTEMQQAGPLVPALQSNWLMMHVTVMILSYAALILGSLLSIAFLIYQAATSSFIKKRDTNTSETTGSAISKNLDFLSYRIIGIGFPFLTIGILSGAVWANEAWGSYWSWDPKETWALLTWLVFAIYLHTRLTKGWEGKKPAIIASLGFIVVWVCYLGVNLLGEGLHSYGFFN
jgi:cytochrome c-type biogenesis protein CcsB